MSTKILIPGILYIVVHLVVVTSSASVLKNVVNRTTRKSVTKIIFPGTKWCGAGNKASSEDERGYFNDTDKCCYEHDACPMNIEGKSKKYGLQNNSRYTKSHCDCDTKFYNCLKSVASRYHDLKWGTGVPVE